MENEILLPEGWRRPSGYSNGMIGQGRILSVGGQIGWNAEETFEHLDFQGQWRQTLENIKAVLQAGGAHPSHLVQMTIYVTDMSVYRSSLPSLGRIWRDVLGKCFPSMALVAVTELVEPQALVEIAALAVLPDQEIE